MIVIKTEIPDYRTSLDGLGFLLLQNIFCRVLDIRVPEIMEANPLASGVVQDPMQALMYHRGA